MHAPITSCKKKKTIKGQQQDLRWALKWQVHKLAWFGGGRGVIVNVQKYNRELNTIQLDFTSFPAVKVLGCFDQHLHQSDRRHFQQ